MSADLIRFEFEGQQVRTAQLDGQPAVVLSDIARVLGYRAASDAARLLRDHQKGYAEVRTPGGTQRMLVVTEHGFNRLVIRSNASNAEAVQDWLTDEVLPSIHKTGSYSTTPALTGSDLLAAAVIEAQAMLAQRDQRIAELEPRAAVADHIMDAEGDMSVGDAAKSLARSGAAIGQTRLFALLDSLRWTYRQGGVRHVSQRAIEAGYLSVRPQSHYHPRTGELVLDPPQVRVRPKGLARLLTHLLPAGEEPERHLEVVS